MSQKIKVEEIWNVRRFGMFSQRYNIWYNNVTGSMQSTVTLHDHPLSPLPTQQGGL